MGTLTIRLPEDLRKELERLCMKENRPFSDVVRDSLRQYLAARKFQMLRGKTLPFAEAQGLLTDEDVFKAIS
jgi:predicted transcriptional regulator